MIKATNYQGKDYYFCGDCKLVYKDKNWNKKCGAWCKKTNGRNIEITEHSIKKIPEDLQ